MALDAYYESRQRKALERSEQLAAIGELAASIAHEVRNPLAGMKGALEILRKDLSKPANREIVDELMTQIVRLENLVRDLLTYARPHPVNPQVFDLHELLDRLLRGCKETADASGITVHRIYGPGSGRLRADPQQLEQVFLNLIQNALQAMEQEGGTLTLTTGVAGGEMVVEFRDTGGGMPEGVLSRVFQPFYTTRHRGSGLGLPIVRKIVEAHDGSIEVTSAPGQGCAATVRLPLQEET
jgi:signal transduction histidine kinase